MTESLADLMCRRVREPVRKAVGVHDPALGRERTHTDDFYDHRKLVLDNISAAIQREKDARKKR